ncbi:MAG: tripartite tricarboxylate transporter substrate-binding protein, partial [Desulfobacterales bacterium]|nr:tripartite tricarboxylate transporter substrate-binding protein [Desulfobacterales bacterium]
MTSRRNFTLGVIALAAGGGTSAQIGNSDKPIRLIAGYSAGGPTDIIARHLAKELSAELKQPVIVENKPGASGNIAADIVGQAAPDGLTLLMFVHAHLINPLMIEKVRYELKDFAPISQVVRLPLVLITGAQSPLNSVQDVVRAAKAQPESISYGSSGIGSSGHLAGALFEQITGTKLLHVPFKGNSQAALEVMAGRVSISFYPTIGVPEMLRSNKIKVLASGTPERHPDMPNIPTMAEAGYPRFLEAVPWLGLVAPAGTPRPIVERISAAVQASLNRPEPRDRLRENGALTSTSSPSEYKAFLEEDAKRWTKL